MYKVGKDSAVDTWTDRYPWAYVDAAKTQLGRLVHGISVGAIRPTMSDVQHLEVALDDLARQAALLRQLLAEVATRHEPHQR